MAEKTDYRSMFDREYIGSFDLPLGSGDLTLTIKRVVGGELTAMGGRKSKKPIIHFRENVKPLICNKTNSKTIAALYSNFVEAWAGKQITLFRSTTRNPDGGDDVECIRVRPKVVADKGMAFDDADAPAYVTPDQATELEAMCTELGVDPAAFKKAGKVERFAEVLAVDFDGAKKWITKNAKQPATA